MKNLKKEIKKRLEEKDRISKELTRAEYKMRDLQVGKMKIEAEIESLLL